jgi:hypothetical protein
VSPHTAGGTIAAGELVQGIVTPGLIRQALAVAGGSTPVKAGGGAIRDATTGGYAGGVATGDDVEQLWGAAGQPWTGFEWSYNYDGPAPFEQHEVLGFSGPDGGGVLRKRR